MQFGARLEAISMSMTALSNSWASLGLLGGVVSYIKDKEV